MDKKSYYIAVGASGIMESQGDAAYEFEIVATEEDILKLRELFEEREDADQEGYVHAHVPWMYTYDGPNDKNDYYLSQVYGMLHELGTEETRKHIEKMNVLPQADE
ncbi:hypothetical protein [Paenibacillus eucommiae]|uniref:Hydrolase n=1 Tax=Paenibacillus eucommiae TaxID=1355755 RepID=A0ABS4IRK0_9BACL|nr:hypothetical protein [Paenibacillus eucommiae]MBP1989204.1 hypothetical protein [Paenibacillus eucommiae]